MNWTIRWRLVLHLDVFPRIRVSRRNRREDVLPLRERHPRPDRVHERVAEHRDQVVVLEDPALDLLGQLLALRRIGRALVLVELAVEVLHADAVARIEPAALEVAFVPERPAPSDAGAVQDDLGPLKLFEPGLQTLEVDATLHGLQ